MPGSLIGEWILQPILEFLFHVVCYYMGRVVVPLVFLGRIKCDDIASDTSRQKLRWGGLFHRRGQQIYLTADATSLVGLLFFVFVGAIVLVMRYSHE